MSANLPPGLDTAIVDGASLVLTYHEDLNTGSVPAASAYSVVVDGGAGTAPSGVSVSGKAVTLTLASAVGSGQVVTVTYTEPASNPLQDATGLAAVALTGQAVTNNTGNNLAGGAPTISGTAQSGQTLTANTSAITDADGLTNVDYDYQWIRVDSDGSSNPTPIGTDSTTYSLINGDVGKKIKVQVDFTDDLGNSEDLTSAAYPSSGTVTANNMTTPQLSIADAQADEGDQITFTVTADNTTTEDITVDYATSIQSGDTAEAGDFTATSGTLTIMAGNTTGTFQVNTNPAQGLYEGDETFTVTISNPMEATIANATARGTILEEDSTPQMKFLQLTFRRGENNDNFFNITFEMTPGFHEAVDFTIEISGTAGNGDDYTLIAEAQSITAQQYGLNIQTQIIDDNIYEGEETAVLRIRVNHNVVTVDPDNDTFELIIDDNDPKPTLRASLHQTGTEGGQNQGITPVQGQDFANVVFKLEMQGGYGMNLPVSLDTVDGTAVAGEDFQLNTTSVTFTPQNNVRYVKVPVIDDDEFQGGAARTFQLKVSSMNNHYIPGSPVFVTGAIKDNEEPAPGEDYVPQGIITNATIDVGQSWINDTQIKGRIEHQNDQDWYLTDLVAGHCYQIDIWGKEMYEHYEDNDAFHVDELTLVDPALIGIYREDGVYLPGSRNYDGWLASTTRHTISVSKSGTYYLAAGHDRWEDGGTFQISLFDMGPENQHCTKRDVDDLTYEPGHFADK